MAIGVNAWAIDNPVLSNVDKVLLDTRELVSGDTEIIFDSSLITDLYDEYRIEFKNVFSAAITILEVTVSVGGVFVTSSNYYTTDVQAGTGLSSRWSVQAVMDNVNLPTYGSITLLPGAADIYPSMRYETLYPHSSINLASNSLGGGFLNSSGIADGIKIEAPGVTTFLGGTFLLYGIPKVL